MINRYKTPLRYPGGKQKLAPFILEIIVANNLVGGDYVEPYAGGAGVAVDLLLRDSVAQIHLNDSSPAIYAFWRSILRNTDEFCRRILGASLTIKEWKRQRYVLSHPSEFSQLDLGFSLFYLNRCNRSGILSGGVIGGLAQTGRWKIDARFPRNELIQRIEAIVRVKKRIVVKNLDAEEFIRDYVPQLSRKTLVYCDPPYYRDAGRLYLNHYKPQDHRRVAAVIQRQLKRPWLVSYDNAPEICACYSDRRCLRYRLQYNASAAYKGTEVFFFSDGLQLPARSMIPSIDLALSA
jgi:DNA adenine methylase